MTFRHVALFRWKPGTTAEQIHPVAPALRALAATLEGLRSYACGPGLGLSETSFDFGVVAEFDDRAGWDAYMANAEHDRIRAELITPIVAERAGIQLES
jgi:hypothetical protein